MPKLLVAATSPQSWKLALPKPGGAATASRATTRSGAIHLTDLIVETVSKTGIVDYLRDSHAGVSRDNGVLPYFGLPRTLPG
jgi:hypothetical protein